MTTVLVIGGGIGGLTTAHELAECGVDVTVLEANDRFGGKARSMPIDDGPAALHGEHGFRFFPAFYRHVVETMARIPDGNGTVADNLVETEATLLASTTGPDRVAETGTPDSVRGWLEALRPAFADELPARDVHFLLERLAYLLTACEKRRAEELDDISWWEFTDAENRSPAFRDRLASTTQSLVALRPRAASARTMGTIYLQLLFGQLDPTRPTEQILNAPTNEAWIDPWIDHLENLGVDLRPNTAARSISFDGRRIDGVELADGTTISADEYVLAVPVDVAPTFVTPELARVAPELGRIERLETAWMNGIQFYLSVDLELSPGHQVYTDSPWALTSISQRQFWTDYDVDERGRTTSPASFGDRVRLDDAGDFIRQTGPGVHPRGDRCGDLGAATSPPPRRGTATHRRRARRLVSRSRDRRNRRRRREPLAAFDQHRRLASQPPRPTSASRTSCSRATTSGRTPIWRRWSRRTRPAVGRRTRSVAGTEFPSERRSGSSRNPSSSSRSSARIGSATASDYRTRRK